MRNQTDSAPQFMAFVDKGLLARGDLATVAIAVREANVGRRLALYRESTGAVFDIDTSGSVEEMLERLAYLYPDAMGEQGGAVSSAPRGRGRPKLGVVSREVSLLPRHWEWLSAQRGSASATLRRLIDEARRADQGEAQVRRLVDAAHRFMWDTAGDEPGFEEASRALYARKFKTFKKIITPWSEGIREQLLWYLERIGELSGESAGV